LGKKGRRPLKQDGQCTWAYRRRSLFPSRRKSVQNLFNEKERAARSPWRKYAETSVRRGEEGSLEIGMKKEGSRRGGPHLKFDRGKNKQLGEERK